MDLLELLRKINWYLSILMMRGDEKSLKPYGVKLKS